MVRYEYQVNPGSTCKWRDSLLMPFGVHLGMHGYDKVLARRQLNVPCLIGEEIGA